MLMPSQPSASAATRPRASPKPPDASIGRLMASAAAGSSTRFGTSSSPGWPAHSKPSIEIASTPTFSAETPWRTEVHLWMTLMPAALSLGRKGLGLLPAVSTIFMPESMMASMYSPYGRGTSVGRIVRLTPNGLSVIPRQRLISLRRSSGVGWVRPVRMPRAPAFETAEASSARPTHCMPPCTIGCLMPNISVKRVLIIGLFPLLGLVIPSISEP